MVRRALPTCRKGWQCSPRSSPPGDGLQTGSGRCSLTGLTNSLQNIILEVHISIKSTEKDFS